MVAQIAGEKGDILKRPVVLGIIVLGIIASAPAQETPERVNPPNFRKRILNLQPQDIGLSRENYPYEVYAVVMESGFDDQFFTLAAAADGSTDLYFSNGRSITGGGEHESVRRATSYLLFGAQHFHKKAQATGTFPSPREGEILFYFLSFNGVLSYRASEEALKREEDYFSDLFFVAHDVINELRKVENLRPQASR
jgi:hypothetical protein